MISKGFLSVGCIVLALYYVQCSSEINLSVSPAIIDVNLTHTMTMNCSMKHAIVSHLVSIVITRLDANDREQIVASVSTFDQALPATDYQNMVVNGTVLEHKVTDNYLLLTWDHPNAHQSSNYTCEINAIDAHSRPVRYSQWMNVPSRVPTTEDIVHHVRVLEKQIEEQQKTITQLMAMVGSLDTRVGVLEGHSG